MPFALLLRRAALLQFLLLFALLATAPFTAREAHAQRPGPNQERFADTDSGKSYVASYALVVLIIFLGIALIARPSFRKAYGGERASAGWLTGGSKEPVAKPGESVRKKPHRGVMLLIIALLGLFCIIPAIIAFTLSKQDLAEIEAGRMDRSGEGLTKAVYILTSILLGLAVVGMILGAIIGAVMAVIGASGAAPT